MIQWSSIRQPGLLPTRQQQNTAPKMQFSVPLISYILIVSQGWFLMSLLRYCCCQSYQMPSHEVTWVCWPTEECCFQNATTSHVQRPIQNFTSLKPHCQFIPKILHKEIRENKTNGSYFFKSLKKKIQGKLSLLTSLLRVRGGFWREAQGWAFQRHLLQA